MHSEAFRHWSQKAAEWGADYRDGLRDRASSRARC
jgi:aromatic-L-amino-acid decarboxylase